MDVLDLLVPPQIRMDDPQGLESVVDVGDRDPAVLEEAGRRRTCERKRREGSGVSSSCNTTTPLHTRGRRIGNSRSVQILIRKLERRNQRTRPQEHDELVEQVEVGCENDETSVDEAVGTRRVGFDLERGLFET